MPRRGRWLGLAGLVGVLALAVTALYATDLGEDQTVAGSGAAGSGVALRGDRVFESNDVIERACSLDKDILARTWRGYYPGRTFDLIFVPQFPNYRGTFEYTGHTEPFDYLQNVPLVLFGKRIAARGQVETKSTLVDVYPTMNQLLDMRFASRRGNVLGEALGKDEEGVPKLVLTLVWDGVGRNVLERWPDAWPNLARLEEDGSSYVNALLGSSPSITPATHSTLGTGVFPRKHGIPTIQMRSGDRIKSAFILRNPKDLEVTTFADDYDLALENEPKVGMLAWSPWHLGMLGHGRQIEGADRDQLGLFGSNDGELRGNDSYYTTPSYLDGYVGFEQHARELDRADGEVDGKWLGHDVFRPYWNPAWVYWQQDAIVEMLEREGYGRDDVPDLFFTNFKAADILGHQYSMASPEMEGIVEALDRSLGELIAYLDAEVGDYVLILTADHGHNPPARISGGWPFDADELERDLLAHFDLTENEAIIEKTTSAGFYMDHQAMRSVDISADEVAEFVNAYTIADNWAEEELPPGFEDRGREHVFSSAFMQRHFPDIMRCAFGKKKSPKDAAR